MNININPNSELNQSIVNVPDMVQVPEVWIHQAHEFQRVMMMYACAIREVKTKLEVLNDELSVKNQRNPIEMIKSRIICSFLDDIYEVAEMLVRQDDVKVIAVKDYIKNPKPNGYRSYHLIIEVPVFFTECKRNMRVEVQIRTIAMDFWASLDHQLKYKKDLRDDSEISQELKQCADVIAQTDAKMLAIRQKIEAQGIAVRKE